MECPKCGYQLDDFTTECPRCARLAQQAADAPPPLPPGPPPPTAYVPTGNAPINSPRLDDQPRTHGLATAALVVSLVGLCTCGIGALVGFVLGIIALVQINNDPRRWKGSGLAIAGIAISVVIVIGLISASSLGFNYMQRELATPEGKLAMAATWRETINQSLARFHTDTGVYPDTLNDLTVRSESALTTKIPHGSYHGPYLQAVNAMGFLHQIGNTGIPANPLVDQQDTVVADHWNYDKQTGTVESTVDAEKVDAIKIKNNRNPYLQPR